MNGTEEIIDEKDKGIDILTLFSKLKTKKTFIIKISLIGFFFGILISFSIPKEYTATAVLTLESESSSASESMGALASLAGINVNKMSSTDVLASPDLYKDIFNSTPFLKGLFNISVKSGSGKDKSTLTLYEYLENKQEMPWWNHIIILPRLFLGLFSSPQDDITLSEEKWNISRQEMNVIQILQDRITVDPNKKTGLTKISVMMQSPDIAVFLTDTLSSYFQSYIIKYRTQKARTDLAFAEKLYNDSKDKYFQAQDDLASFLDENRNVISAKFRTIQERLQSEATLRYSIYNQAAQQLQLARVKVQDQTPVLTTIQPAVKPLIPSKPSKQVIILASTFFACIGSIFWLLRKDLYNYLSDNN